MKHITSIVAFSLMITITTKAQSNKDVYLKSALVYSSAYQQAANEIGVMKSKFGLVDLGVYNKKAVLAYYNQILGKNLGIASTYEQAMKLIQDKGFAFMEVQALIAQANYMKSQKKSNNHQ